jgi:general secretion pathway protein I
MPSSVLPSERGFTLLEILIAFAIAALAIGVLFSGALGGLRAAHVASNYETAVAMARSHLAAIGNGPGLTAREQEGTEGDGFHFRIKILPAGSVVLPRTDTEVAQGTPPLQAMLMNINVVVSWTTDGATRQVELDTRRLTSGPAQQ